MTRHLLALALLVASPVVAATTRVTEVHYVMGTYFRITAEHADGEYARRALRGCFATARRFDELFSRFDPSSELSRINATAETAQTVTVSSDMAALLRRALALQAATDDAFDVSIGALTQLWRTVDEWPARGVRDAARRTGGRGALRLTGAQLTRRAGTLIDLDGIAKGWAVDGCVAQLRRDGIERALLSFGESSVYALGAPSGARGWDVAVRALDPDAAVGTLTLRDEALSVSGVFGHERRIGDRHVGHIVDPRNGQPLTMPATAVVVARSATDAEAFSKALLIRREVPLADGRVVGTLLIGPHGVRRGGAVRFTPFRVARPIATSAEPLR